MDEQNMHSLILHSRINRFRNLSQLINTGGIIAARAIWKLFSKATLTEKDKEMKPWQ